MSKKKKEKELANKLVEDLDSLESLFNDKISELHKVKGMQSERHSFIYYRSLIWSVKNTLINH